MLCECIGLAQVTVELCHSYNNPNMISKIRLYAGHLECLSSIPAEARLPLHLIFLLPYAVKGFTEVRTKV